MADHPVSDLGVPVTLADGREARFYPLSWGAMRRTRAQRALIYQSQAAVGTPEWEDAVLDVLYESVISPDVIAGREPALTKDAFAELVNSGLIKKCFNAMTKATTVAGLEVADESEGRPTSSPNGTTSTATLSPAQAGHGTSATN